MWARRARCGIVKNPIYLGISSSVVKTADHNRSIGILLEEGRNSVGDL